LNPSPAPTLAEPVELTEVAEVTEEDDEFEENRVLSAVILLLLNVFRTISLGEYSKFARLEERERAKSDTTFPDASTFPETGPATGASAGVRVTFIPVGKQK